MRPTSIKKTAQISLIEGEGTEKQNSLNGILKELWWQLQCQRKALLPCSINQGYQTKVEKRRLSWICRLMQRDRICPWSKYDRQHKTVKDAAVSSYLINNSLSSYTPWLNRSLCRQLNRQQMSTKFVALDNALSTRRQYLWREMVDRSKMSMVIHPTAKELQQRCLLHIHTFIASI